MPLTIVDEKYNGAISLRANAGDWIDAEMKFSVRFSKGSGTSNKITWHVQGSNYWFQAQAGDWGEQGFLAGDTITVSYQFYPAGPWQSQSKTFTILYITGLSMYVDQPFTLNPTVPSDPSFSHIDGRQFPTENYVSGLLILADKQPDSVEFQFNLTPNGATQLNSVIDGELNRFELPEVVGIPTGVPQLMTQLINRSGGLIKDVDLTLMATPGGGWRDYRVRYKFIQWGIIQEGFAEPDFYELADCLAPIVKIKAFAEYGNPNGVQTDISDNIEASTGGFDENYNGGASLYQSTGTAWIDSLLNPIDKLDYSGTSSFTATIDGPNQVDPTSTYRIGLVWRPTDGSYYQNKIENIGENLLILAPEIDFIANGVIDPTIYQGLEDSNGARWDFQNLKFEVTGPNEITVSGDVIPNAFATQLFSGIVDEGRKSTLWVSIGDFASDGTSLSKRVSLKIFDEDNYDAPTLGVQIPDVIDESLLDHAGNDVITPDPQTTTEDDVLYRSNFHLLDNKAYEGVRARISAYNTVTEEEFTLEEIYFAFTSVPFISGQFQPNFITNRGFNLPPTTDRNEISLTRNPALDIAGKYALTLDYGYLNRWEYWLSQANVDNDFFDINEIAFDGKNKNWQRFSNSGDWVVRISYFLRFDGVDDFNYLNVGIRPFEDEDAVTTTTTTILSNGLVANDFVNDEFHLHEAKIEWLTNNYDPLTFWAEVKIEDFESGNVWWISSILPQGNVNANPLKPIVGEVGLNVTFNANNIVTLSLIVDTNVISANKVCLSYRIYSEIGEPEGAKHMAPGDEPKFTTWGDYKIKATI